MQDLKDFKKLRAWWESSLGQIFLQEEAAVVKEMVSTLFGYHLLLLGELLFSKCISESPISHKVCIHPEEILSNHCSVLTTRYDKLPILADSIDVAYLAHCLEFVNNPHEVLREIFRVLIPEGYVLISTFNPWSLWGIWRYLVRFIKRAPWDGHSITLTRLKDWLALLGFDVIKVSSYCFLPPIAHPSILKYFGWLEKVGKRCWPFWGSGHVVLARKRIITLTPIKPAFQTKRKVLIADVIEPAGID